MPDPDKQHIIDVPKLHPDIQAAIDPETNRLVERYRTKPRKKKNARDDRESG